MESFDEARDGVSAQRGLHLPASLRAATTAGVWILIEPCVKLDSPCTDEELGGSALRALAASRIGVAHPSQTEWGGLLAPLMHARRAWKSWSAFARLASCAELESDRGANLVLRDGKPGLRWVSSDPGPGVAARGRRASARGWRSTARDAPRDRRLATAGAGPDFPVRFSEARGPLRDPRRLGGRSFLARAAPLPRPPPTARRSRVPPLRRVLRRLAWEASSRCESSRGYVS